MIKYKRVSGDVHISHDIDTPDYGTRVYTIPINMNDELKASFVANAFTKQMWDKLSKIREDAYNEGWAQGRSHKVAKREYFTGRW